MALGSSPLGMYVPGSTPLHRLDPRVKIALLLVWTVALFGIQAWGGLAAVAAAAAALAAWSRIPLGRFARNLAPMAVVLAVIVLSNALRFDGSGAWGIAGTFGVSPDGLDRGLKAVSRIVLMVALALLATSTTTVTALMEALLSILGPLRRLRVPVDDLATMLSIAIRFIPVCGEQFDRVVLAQRARGARVGEGGVVERVSSWVPVMVPLFVGLFRRSDALAGAMAARCYRGEGRTCLTTLRLRPSDALALAAGVALAIASALAF